MKRGCLVLFAAFALATTTARATTNDVPARPSIWAQPVAIAGITNCFRISAALYRGSQPSTEGMHSLQVLGIKSVINLRSLHSDKDELAGTGLKGFRFYTKPWHAEQEDVVGFLKIVTDTNNLPVFIHCQRGADRTGTMCAMYRLAVCGWTKEEALSELQQGGFHFAPVWKNLVAFIQHADVQKIRQQAGLNNPSR